MLRHRFSVTSQEWKRHKLVQIAQDWINYINRWRTFGERAAGQWAVARQGHHALFSGSVERRSVARAEALEAGGSTLVGESFFRLRIGLDGFAWARICSAGMKGRNS